MAQDVTRTRMLRVLKVLMDNKDAGHMSPTDIRARLKEQGVPAGTGTVETDLEILARELPGLDLGVEVQCAKKCRGKGKPIWKAVATGLTRNESRVVASAIEASTFLTEGERRGLSKKLRRNSEGDPPLDVIVRAPYSEVRGEQPVSENAGRIARAILDKKMVRFVFRKAGSPQSREERTVMPAGLVFSAGHYYLLAENKDRMLHSRRLERIESPRCCDEGWEPVGPEAVRRRVLTSVNMFFSNEEPDEATRQWYPRELWGISGGFLALAPGMSWLVEDMFGEMCARVALGEDEAAALPEGHGELVFFLYQRSYPLYGWLVGQGGKALVVAPNRRWLGCKTRLGVEERKGPRLEVFFREATGAAGATRPQLHAKFEHDYDVMMRTGSQGLPSYPDFLSALAQGRDPL